MHMQPGIPWMGTPVGGVPAAAPPLVPGGYPPVLGTPAPVIPPGRSLTLRHARLTTAHPHDDLGLVLEDGESFPVVKELPRLRRAGPGQPAKQQPGTGLGLSASSTSCSSSSSASSAAGGEGGLVDGVTATSGAVQVGNCLVGVSGVLCYGLSAAAALQVINAARQQAAARSVVLHFSNQAPPARSQPLAKTHI